MNNKRIKFTDFPYWKKDFLEQAPAKYATYLQRGQQNQIDDLLKRRISDPSLHQLMQKNLTPKINHQNNWLKWYVRFSENEIRANDTAELIEYIVDNSEAIPVIKDSVSICKTFF